jgi:hypothetical protein
MALVKKWEIDNDYLLQKAFEDMGRGNQFTRYDLFIEHFDQFDEDIELDVIALCVEYTEYETIEEYNDNYGTTYETIEDLANDQTVLFDDEEKAFIVLDH